MPEPVSTALGLCFGFAALAGYRRNDSAYSDEAKAVAASVTKIMRASESSQALFGAKATALAELRKTATECSKDNWDADGALAIDEMTIWNAEDFIRALPDNFPLPEVAPEPDGAISLDWIESQYRMFSLSIGTGSRLAYAWLDGTDTGHGVAHFDGVGIPQRILTEIGQTIGHGKPSLRTI